MGRKLLCTLLALGVLLTGTTNARAEMYADAYADVPSAMTQDAVLAFEAEPLGTVEVLQPDPAAATLLEALYDFVWRQGQRPVRFYDAATQQQIALLADGTAIDSLYMTEFVGIQLPMPEAASQTVTMRMTLAPDYFPGQLIIVVMGRQTADGAWEYFPYRGEVPEHGIITYDMPGEDFLLLAQERAVLHVLTVRPGPDETQTHAEHIEQASQAQPSKTAADISQVIGWRNTNGTNAKDWFRIFFVGLTGPMAEELTRLGDFLAEGHRAIAWFPEEIRQQALTMRPEGLALDEMVIYDAAAVMAEHYQETYGDVVTENRFPTAYRAGKATFALLGLWRDADAASGFEWHYLRADALSDGDLEIAYQQLLLPQMEVQPAFLLIFSETLTEEEAK